jgi:hypothetical protein
MLVHIGAKYTIKNLRSLTVTVLTFTTRQEAHAIEQSIFINMSMAAVFSADCGLCLV